jgi:hypothetical protein
MYGFKGFFVLVVATALVGLMGRSCLVMADESDPPHVTHLTHARGPHIGTECDPYPGSECDRCHNGSPAWNNVDTGHYKGGLMTRNRKRCSV